jgi:WhiB family redox-sensing transcriptional regulator
LREEDEGPGAGLGEGVVRGLSRGSASGHGSKEGAEMSAKTSSSTGSNAQGIVAARGVNAPTAWTDAPSLVTPEPWVQDALCAQVDPEPFFPPKGGSTLAAKSVCAACDVQAECLDYALRTDERFGIWGGKSERERRSMKRAAAAGEATR